MKTQNKKIQTLLSLLMMIMFIIVIASCDKDDDTGSSRTSLDTPEEREHEIYVDSIIWRWSGVDGADGYRFHTSNNFDDATDLGLKYNYKDSLLERATSYKRYLWAYNNRGLRSEPLEMEETTGMVSLEELNGSSWEFHMLIDTVNDEDKDKFYPDTVYHYNNDTILNPNFGHFNKHPIFNIDKIEEMEDYEGCFRIYRTYLAFDPPSTDRKRSLTLQYENQQTTLKVRNSYKYRVLGYKKNTKLKLQRIEPKPEDNFVSHAQPTGIGVIIILKGL